MQSCKYFLRRSNPSTIHRKFLSNYKHIHLNHGGINQELENQVLVQGKSSSRTAILNRPNALNALNTNMCARLKKLYESWEENPDIGFIAVKGSGRAFCAGGDVVAIYRSLIDGRVEDCKEFFKTIYSLIYLVGTYMKPNVALMDGVTMGGGAGVSIPGMFRVVSEKTVFATPETHIGFHPDAGASFYLSHLPGYLGEYLALTGEKLNGAEMIASGLATHYSNSTKFPWIEEHLGKLVTDDPSVIETSLEEYSEVAYPDDRSVMHRNEIVDKCFSRDTVEEIIDTLENEAIILRDEWCTSTLKKLKEACPLALKVSLRSIREGRYQSLDECLIREYRMSLQGISKQLPPNFCEGVRARLVDKDCAPKWDPSCLEQVTKDMVEHYFSPLGNAEPELELPTKMREAFI
ncbi:3-hydroxyisobutyryl-CoA hydrolase [Ranunculus cassubicifolius]